MKAICRVLSSLILVVGLSACSGTISTVKKEKVGYAVSREQAKEIVDSAILAFISPDYINPAPKDSLTQSGYVRILLDTCTVNATAIPITGYDSAGNRKKGYGFLVSYWGTLMFPTVPGRVYNFIKDSASASGEPLAIK